MQESSYLPRCGCQSRCCSPKQGVMAQLGTCSPSPAWCKHCDSCTGHMWLQLSWPNEQLLSMVSLSPVNASKASLSTRNVGQHSFWFLVPSIRGGMVSSAVEQEQIHTSGWKNLHILLESLSYMKCNRNKAARGKWAASLKDKVLSLLEKRLQLPFHS